MFWSIVRIGAPAPGELNASASNDVEWIKTTRSSGRFVIDNDVSFVDVGRSSASAGRRNPRPPVAGQTHTNASLRRSKRNKKTTKIDSVTTKEQDAPHPVVLQTPLTIYATQVCNVKDFSIGLC